MSAAPAHPRGGRRCAAVSISLALIGGVPVAAAQQLTRFEVAAPGAMVSVCAGLHGGTNPGAGELLPTQAAGVQCLSGQTAVAGATVSRAASHSQALIDHASAQASAQMGLLKLQSSFRANNSVGFAGGSATAGWEDQLTLQPLSPADLGQPVLLSFQIQVDGSLQALPSGNGFSSLQLRPYLDGAFLPAGASNPGIQIAGQGQPGFPYQHTVDAVYTFQAPVLLGKAFELSVYARAAAGVAGAGPDVWSEAHTDFGHTLRWAGISAVTLGGAPVGYTLSSASGIDWTPPFAAPVPEPASAALLAAGLLGLLHRQRRRAQACRAVA